MPYVSLDLETTGLDPDVDEIIEVGAVRFDASGVLDTYHSLVNPDKHVEYRIEMLTGIDPAELHAAPHFAAIASDVQAFIGFDPIVGQNPTFDVTFLSRKGVDVFGPAYDTFELANILLDGLGERSLGAIADHLGIEFTRRHRALDDADAARRVFAALRERLALSPSDLLAEADRIAGGSDWSLRHLFHEIASERPRRPGDGEREGIVHGFVRAPEALPEAVQRGNRNIAVPPQQSVDLLTSGAARDAVHDYEERREQTIMARAVGETLAEGGELLVEAGTGVGKSLAYIIPSALHAVRNNARTVISTNTINLQEQLIAQDIPIARRILESAGIDVTDLRVTQLKGRSNYLCLLRWAASRRASSMASEEAQLLVKLLFWLGRTETGDRAELRLRREEDPAWSRVSAQDAGCISMQCVYVRDGSCFLHRAKKRAEAAHLLVVNHALLLSDVAAAGNVLPQYEHLVVDEAHHLEEQATQQFGFSASESDLLDWLESLQTRAGRDREGGLAASIINATRASQQAVGAGPQLQQLARQLAGSARKAREAVPPFFRALQAFGQQHASSRGDYDDRIVISRGIRVQPDWADIEASWFETDEKLEEAANLVDELAAMLGQINPSDILDRDAVLAEANECLATGMQLREGLSRIIGHDDRQMVCWLNLGRRDASPMLASAPLIVAERLKTGLFSPRESVVLTSATLTTDDRFDYIKSRLGFEDARELMLGSPFDYRASTLIVTPSDMPEPNHPGYVNALHTALIELVSASEGRALVLFTSHSALRTAYAAIKRPLEEQQILVLGQGLDGSPKQLLSVLRENHRTVLLGAASFWEGVDVTGEALSLLVVARLPFSVPSDPVFQARSELFDQPFDQYAVPQAILRFKQGFGRLIRRKTDRGVVVALDRRLRSKQYGESFIRSLPNCTLREVPSREMPDEVAAWLARPLAPATAP